jgi:putative protease
MRQPPEIMSPAGNWTCLHAAVNAGCDAVYFGIENLNMRAAAKNFTVEELPEIASCCHANTVKAYLTLNTIVYEKELPLVSRILTAAKQGGIDAVICSDFAVIEEAGRQELPVYISTQLSVSNSSAITYFFTNWGVKRFVLARECSLEDIYAIRTRLSESLGAAAKKIEIEVFAHGAMCVSVSGRCFLSEHIHGKSANRGVCLQPCRREYHVVERDKEFDLVLGHNYILSPRDLCTLPFVDKLIDAGVASLKIEGRNRNPEYVSIVTSAYRRAVDHYCSLGPSKKYEIMKKKLVEEVKKVYNREFSSGFFLGIPVDEWTERYGSSATTTKFHVGIVKKYYNKIGVAEIQVQNNPFSTDDTIMFQGPSTGVVIQKAGSIEIDHVKITMAEKGSVIAVKTESRVKPNDRVFVVRENV